VRYHAIADHVGYSTSTPSTPPVDGTVSSEISGSNGHARRPSHTVDLTMVAMSGTETLTIDTLDVTGGTFSADGTVVALNAGVIDYNSSQVGTYSVGADGRVTEHC